MCGVARHSKGTSRGLMSATPAASRCLARRCWYRSGAFCPLGTSAFVDLLMGLGWQLRLFCGAQPMQSRRLSPRGREAVGVSLRETPRQSLRSDSEVFLSPHRRDLTVAYVVSLRETPLPSHEPDSEFFLSPHRRARGAGALEFRCAKFRCRCVGQAPAQVPCTGLTSAANVLGLGGGDFLQLLGCPCGHRGNRQCPNAVLSLDDAVAFE